MVKQVRVRYEIIVETDVQETGKQGDETAKRIARSLRVLPSEIDEKYAQVVAQHVVTGTLLIVA